MADVMTARPPSILIAEAERLLLSGSLASASTLLEEYLVDHPEETAVLRTLARIRMLQDRPDDAADLLAKTLVVLRNNVLAQWRVNGNPGRDRQVSDYLGGADDDALSSHDFVYIEQNAHELRKKRTYYDYEGDEAGPQEKPILKDFCRESDDVHIPPEEKEAISHDDTSAEVHITGIEPSTELEQAEREPNSFFPESDKLIDLQEPATDDESVPLDSIEAPERFVVSTEGAPEPPAADISHDWDAIDPYLLDFDEAPTREELDQDVQTDGKIGRQQRALQEAINLGSQYGWEAPETYLLAEVFEKYWWSKAKHSMVRELEAGLKPDELRLALVAREIWQQYEEFAVNLDGYPYTALSWPMALKIVRSFHAYPEPEEIENFLLEAYAEWQSRGSLAQRHRSYVDYLINRLSFPNDRYMVSPNVTLESDYDWSEDDYLSSSNVGLNTPQFQSLVEYGLIPDIWTDPCTVSVRKNREESTDAEGEDDE